MNAADLLTLLHQAGAAVSWNPGGIALRVSGALAPGLAIDAKSGVAGLQALLASDAGVRGARQVRSAPLSREQERLWFWRAMAGAGDALIIPLALRFPPGVPVPPSEAIAAAAARHPMLGALFRGSRVEPRMVFLDPPPPPEEQVVDLRGLPLVVARQARASVLRDDARRPFDLTRTPGLRTVRIFEPDGGVVLQITRDHLVSDGWSLGLLLREIVDAAARLAAGRPPAPRERALLYADYACRQRVQERPLRLVEGVDALRRPPRMFGSPRPGGTPRVARSSFDGGALLRFCRTRRLTAFAVLCGAFSLALGVALSRREIAFGIDVSTRDRPELETCIGSFVNRAPLACVLPVQGPIDAYLGEVAAKVRTAAAGASMPFEELVAAADLPRGHRYDPMFDVIFGLHGEPRHAPYRHLGPVEAIDVDNANTHAPLSVYLTADGASFHVETRYDDGYLVRATVDGLVRAFKAAVAAIAAEACTDIAALRRCVLALEQPLMPVGQNRITASLRKGRLP